MKATLFTSLTMAAVSCLLGAASTAHAAPDSGDAASPSLTIYNQQFAVVRQEIPLDLKAGVNQVRYSDISAHVQPDSVVLRDPTGRAHLRVLEQNYRGDVLSQEMLLSLYEGKTIDFQTRRADGTPGEIVQGKIIRSGYIPHYDAYGTYGNNYYYQQQQYSVASQPLIEVGGKLEFQLPGTPLFPALTDDSILKPALEWSLTADESGPLSAELAYITGGMSWQAAYNVVSPETGSTLDLTGWVTIDNQTGKDFDHARVKLMAGDVNTIQPPQQVSDYAVRLSLPNASATAVVTQKAFDEYHLYTLPNPTTLRDRETKQVEFIRAPQIASRQLYVYDGVNVDPQRYNGWGYENIRSTREYGTEFTPKVSVMREFENTDANGLGVPLPAGRLRFYRRDADGQLEFVGERMIDHTPKGETVRVTTGNAFDLVGSRTQTDYKFDNAGSMLDESFSINLKNHKETPVDILVVEHLYRALNWAITQQSHEFRKKDAHTIEFPVTVPPNGQETVTYTVHYTW